MNAKGYLVILTTLFLVGLLPGCGGAGGAKLDRIRVPKGFHIEVFANCILDARSMALSPGGILFVGTRRAGNVYAIRDTDGDFKADQTVTIAAGLNWPNGVAFHDGDLYVAEIHRVIKFPDIENALRKPPTPVIVRDDFPKDRSHVRDRMGDDIPQDELSRADRKGLHFGFPIGTGIMLLIPNSATLTRPIP